ncbi:AT-rich interactive domain-containing protein 3A [Protopterus annectens]|uniref:AT-rich interactive domain-containing protein 3A n=1 Tax=Protopterus annectens TaxID=7888 RepID=UPI001CF9CA34|nr:AT-rich interactive domain-containing protein 3A [Protopterus annectens]
MKLQAVMENLQRQQRARLQQELEARQQHQEHTTMRSSSASSQNSGPRGGNSNANWTGVRREDSAAAVEAAPTEDGDSDHTLIQRAQIAALAAMRAAAAGLDCKGSPGMSGSSHSSDEGEGLEDEEEDELEQGIDRFRDTGSEEEDDDSLRKRKWDEEDYDDDEMGEEGFDEDLEEEEAVKPSPRAVHHKSLLQQQQKGDVQQLSSGQDLAARQAHLGHSQLQQQMQDHGDWTYEEQFKQLYELNDDPKRKEFLDDLFSFMQKRGGNKGMAGFACLLDSSSSSEMEYQIQESLRQDKREIFMMIVSHLLQIVDLNSCYMNALCYRKVMELFPLNRYMKYLYPYECEKRALSNPTELQAAIDSNRREGRRHSFGGSLFTYSPTGAPTILSSPKLQVPSLGLAAATNGSPMTPIQKIKKDTRQETAMNLSLNGTNSISMSVEINGIVYTGVLFAQAPATSSSSSNYTKGNHSKNSGSQGVSTVSVPPASTSSNSSP